MTFEEWWDKKYEGHVLANPIENDYAKHVAEKAWDSGFTEGYGEGYHKGCLEKFRFVRDAGFESNEPSHKDDLRREIAEQIRKDSYDIFLKYEPIKINKTEDGNEMHTLTISLKDKRIIIEEV